MSRVDAKLSKLDRFLVCSNFVSAFPDITMMAHPRELSDHSPITLKQLSSDFGPTPFKFFNSWLLIEGIDQTVIEAWGNFKEYDISDKYLVAKLRHMKEAIKKWRRLNHQKETDELLNLKNNVATLEKVAEYRTLSYNELMNRSHGF